MTVTDEELQREFEAVVAEQLDALYRTALRLQGNPADAEDAVQECCARAYYALSGFKRDASLKVWLFRILKNVCIDKLRWRSRFKLVCGDAGESAIESQAAVGETPEDACLRSNIGRLVDRAIRGLPVEQRAVVALVLIEEFSYAEAAETLQIPIGTVRSRLNRARAQLRQAIASDNGTGAAANSPDGSPPGRQLGEVS